jgi:hypothetical protein
MRMPPSIKVMYYLGKGLILFGLACVVMVAKLHLRDARWMGTAIELEVAGVGLLFSGMGMWTDYRRDQEIGRGFDPRMDDDTRWTK